MSPDITLTEQDLDRLTRDTYQAHADEVGNLVPFDLLSAAERAGWRRAAVRAYSWRPSTLAPGAPPPPPPP